MNALEDKLRKETQRNIAVNTAKCAMQSQEDYYHPWQRTRKPQRPTVSEQSRLSSSIPSDRDSRPLSVGTVRSACSSKCQHSWNIKKCVVPPIAPEEDKRRRRLVTELKVVCLAIANDSL